MWVRSCPQISPQKLPSHQVHGFPAASLPCLLLQTPQKLPENPNSPDHRVRRGDNGRVVRPERIFSSAESTSITTKNATGLLNIPTTRTNLLHPQKNENEVGPSPSGMLYYCIFGGNCKFFVPFFGPIQY